MATARCNFALFSVSRSDRIFSSAFLLAMTTIAPGGIWGGRQTADGRLGPLHYRWKNSQSLIAVARAQC